MALNNLGLGLTISAKDAATAVFNRVQKTMGDTAAVTAAANKTFVDGAAATKKMASGLTEAAAAAARAAGAFQDAAGKWRAANGKFLSKDQLGALNSGSTEAVEALRTVEAGATKTHERLEKLGGTLKLVGGVLIGFGSGILAALGIAANEATKFGAAIAEVTTLVDESVTPVEQLRKVAMKMAETFGGDVTDQVKALYQTISSGVTDMAKAEELLAVANKLAIGGVTSTFTAVDLLTSVTAAYASSALSAAEATDILFTAVMIGKTTAEELGSTLGRVAPLASSLGVTFKELNAVIAAVTLQGINTAEAVTGMKAAFANIIKPTKNASDEAKRLGIQFDAAALRSMGFKKFLEQITSAAGYNADSLGKLFESTEALNAMTALAANGGKGLTDALTAMDGSSGATDRAFKKMTESFDFAAKLLKTKFQVALIKVGDIILPILAKITRGLVIMVDWFNGLSDRTRSFLVWGALITAVLAVIVGTLLVVTGLVLAAAPAWAALTAAVGGFAPYALAIVAAVGLVILALKGLKDAYDRNLGGFAKAVNAVYSQVKLTLDALGQLFSDGGFSGEVLKALDNGNDGIRNFAIQVFLWFNRIKNFVVGIGQGFEAGLRPLRPVFRSIVEAIRELFNITGLQKDSTDEAKASWEAFGRAGQVVGNIIVFIFGLISQAVLNVLELWNGLKQGFKGAGPVAEYLKSAFVALAASIDTAMGSIRASLGGTADASSAWRTFGQVLGFVVGVIGYMIGYSIRSFAQFLAVVGAVVGGVIGMLDGLWTSTSGMFTMIAGLLTGDGAKVWLGFKMLVFGVLKSIISFVATFVETIGAMVDSVGKAFGKDLGIQKAIQGGKADLLKDLQGGLGLNADGNLKVTTTKNQLGNKAMPVPEPRTSYPAIGGDGGRELETPMHDYDEDRNLSAAPPNTRLTSGRHVGAVPPLAPPTMPAAAAAQAAMATPQFAQAAAPAAPVVVNLTSNLMVDGQRLAQSVQQANVETSNRQFGPPTPQR